MNTSQIVSFVAFGVIIVGGFLWTYNQMLQFRNAAYQLRQGLLPNPTTTQQDTTTNWQTHTIPLLGLSFKYPQDHFAVIDQQESGTNFIHKLELTAKDSTTRVTLLAWKKPINPITKSSIETWCRHTLLSEAKQQNILCALLSPPAISETNLFGKTVFKTKYASSFNQQIDFFIIPQSNYVFTVHVITPNEGSNQTPLLLQILSTFKFLE